MRRRFILAAALISLASFCGLNSSALAQGTARENAASEAPRASDWSFAVSGDSRNCGDVVVPAIASGVKQSGASFYWHLGDLRAIYTFDEDILHQPEHIAKPLSISGYELFAWDDFIQSQIAAFGDVPFFVGIGNHETIPPMTRERFTIQFADWLDTPVLQRQRLADNPKDRMLRTYYHWIDRGLDFIYLDNATDDQFDSAQMQWFEKVLQAASANPHIATIVLGMHEALPESISANHSMNQSAAGVESGRRVYADLLKAQDEAHKRVYVLSSHSHYFMDGIFNTDYWRAHGGVLSGWIVGTAGAVRYKLPDDHSGARIAQTNVYGFLLGTVKPDGEIHFQFQPVNEPDVPAKVVERYKPEFVHWCFDQNSQAK
ncbi:MAG: hypothetical protein WB780_16815 [Candidatus Acidiferrales bacterium]